jgi:diaminopimelate epimerase
MIHFTKMHGAGNDYVFVDCFDREMPADVPALARAMSDRHTGIGADGVILICPSDEADARMQMWNADGSSGEMCGNGIRCVAKYLYEHGRTQRDVLHIATDNGVRRLEVSASDGRVTQVRVNMGRPILEASKIPTTLEGNPPLDVVLPLDGRAAAASGELAVTAISMGNPHCVTFVEELSDEMVLSLGPQIENHPAFPNRVNVEFVQVLSPTEVRMRVWERGTGETQACGSGACAAHVAGVLTGRIERTAVCHLPGGDLKLQWLAEEDVYMTGPAIEVFSGEWPEG